MEKSQQNFIIQNLNEYQISEKENYINKLNEVSILKILNQKFFIGSDMNELLSLFDSILLLTSKNNNCHNGIYNLTEDILKWFTKIKKLPVQGTEGFIYTADIFSNKLQVIIKSQQYNNKSNFSSMLKEYFIGIKAINNLRYILPTFVYTLGAFTVPNTIKTFSNLYISKKITDNKKELDNIIFVIYEKIPGTSLDNLLLNEKINFDEWILIFFQLLLSLEIAQRKIRFSHFDLHVGNVMIRKKNNFSYTVPLDNKSYCIKNCDIFPVVIDFGMSSSYIEGRYIGRYDFAKYGILNFMVPGFDMYKFIIYSMVYAKNKNLKNNIRQLFKFYGSNDPYNIFSMGDTLSATDKYCRDVTYSKAANYTPIMFMNWLLDNYSSKLLPYINVSNRSYYKNLQYTSRIKEYNDSFKKLEGINKAIKLSEECLKKKNSYIITKYNIKILEKYNKYLNSTKIKSLLKGLKKRLEYSNDLIFMDNIMLENVFKIKLPTQHELTKVINNILEIQIRHSNSFEKKIAVKKLDILVYQEKLQSYLQIYYTIMDLKLEDKFSEWIYKFKKSDIYIFYTKNIIQNERAVRWGQTLLASII